MFCWLTVGAGARFLNLKGSPVNSACWAQLNLEAFGKFWKRLCCNSLSGLVTGSKTFSPARVCLSPSRFFSNPVFLAKSKWWVYSSKWVSQSLFLTWLHSSWIVCIFLSQHGCEGQWSKLEANDPFLNQKKKERMKPECVLSGFQRWEFLMETVWAGSWLSFPPVHFLWFSSLLPPSFWNRFAERCSWEAFGVLAVTQLSDYKVCTVEEKFSYYANLTN